MDLTFTLKQHAYRLILDRLRSGVMLPGSRITEDKLAREIGISRAPVREAIGQLAIEGFLEYTPRKGVTFRFPNRAEMEELYEARLALEVFVAAKAAECATESDLAELDEINRQLRTAVVTCRRCPGKTADNRLMEHFLRIDMQFHGKLLQLGANRKISEMVQECLALIDVFVFAKMAHDLRLMALTYREHASILRAIRRRDSEEASLWMARHLKRSARDVLDRVVPAS